MLHCSRQIFKRFPSANEESFNLVVQFLLMELEIGGNIQFQEGLSNNLW